MTSRPSSSASRACPPTDGSDAWSNLGCPRRWRFQRDAARPRRCSWPGLTAAVAGAPLRRAVLRRPSAPVSASPGHQAGAPLRQRRRRPSWSWPAHFPRPSGRGSIAATGRPAHRRRTTQLPPAIRPGLHCGSRSRTLPGSSPSASPGHQAGAPLRQVDERVTLPVEPFLPPAIRPGLHCGGGIFGNLTATASASPGHQAGAPLRRCGAEFC